MALRKRRSEFSLEKHEKTAVSYKKRKTLTNTPQNYSKMKLDLNVISCPICMDLIICATVTVCGHTFCEKCLTEALVLSAVLNKYLIKINFFIFIQGVPHLSVLY